LCSSSKATYKLRWFTPLKEVDICGHATIASLHFLTEKEIIQISNSVTFETRSGILNCSIHSGEYGMQLPVCSVTELTQLKEEIISAFNIPENIIDIDTPFFTLSNNFLFIKIKSYSDLISYTPKFNIESEIFKKYPDVSLYTIETIEEENTAHQRFFAPGFGITEDPVTGSASAYLALVLLKAGLVSKDILKESITVEQGDHLGRKGRVKVSFNQDTQELIIKGKAVTFLKGNIFI
ncbi:MAG: PhzF family phenazine biosynthesis protein, partial [Ignavibacteriaceae bacterium]|nr:PhzF family phenazine biosynthesis protein [Ignavibacteriaceae bacterium]